MLHHLKYHTSNGLFPYIGLSKPCDGPTFSGPPNRKPNEGGTSTRGFRKFGFLKLILSKTLNPSSSVGLKCKANHMIQAANELFLTINWTITEVVFFLINVYAISLHQRPVHQSECSSIFVLQVWVILASAYSVEHASGC